jgi:hypothetical protein
LAVDIYVAVVTALKLRFADSGDAIAVAEGHEITRPAAGRDKGQQKGQKDNFPHEFEIAHASLVPESSQKDKRFLNQAHLALDDSPAKN